MKALVRYSHLKKKIKILNIKKPQLSKDSKTHAIIKIKYSGICGRDIEHFKKKISINKVPYVLGHEFSGLVEQINKNKFGIKVNDKVVCETVENVCEKCSLCKSGFYNLCKKRKNIGSGLSGSFASHIKVPIKYIHKLPTSVPLDEAALIEPLAVCYNALIKNSKINANSKVLIFGAGTIGLICLKIAKYKKAKIYLVCTNLDKIQTKLARKIGVKKIYFSNQNYKKKILNNTNNEGVDLILDTVGGIDKTFQDSIEIVKPGGQITKVGWFMRKMIFADFDKIIRKNIKIQGSFSHNYEIWEKCIKLLSQKKINLKDLISKKCGIEKWKNAFKLIMKRRAIKILMFSNE